MTFLLKKKKDNKKRLKAECHQHILKSNENTFLNNRKYDVSNNINQYKMPITKTIQIHFIKKISPPPPCGQGHIRCAVVQESNYL